MMKNILCGLMILGCVSGDCWGMNNGCNTEDSGSDSFSRSSTSSSLSEEWMDSRRELINKACYDEDAFCALINEITESSDSEEDKKMLYENVESTWNDENAFEAVIINNTFYSYHRDRF